MIFVEEPARVARWWAEQLGDGAKLHVEQGGFCWFDASGVEVGFHAADNTRNPRSTSPVLYWSVDDLARRRGELLAAGCFSHLGPIRLRAARSICQMVDPFGNVFGLDGTPGADGGTRPVDAPDRSTGARGVEDVKLRALRVSDVDVLVEQSAAETRPDVPHNRPRDKLLEQIERAPCLESDGYVEYAVEASGVLVGTLQVRAPAHAFPPGVCELGIVMFPAARGRGIGRRAVEAVTAHLLDGGWKRIQAGTSVSNRAMQRILTLAGYRREGVMFAYAPGPDAAREDYQLWAIIAES